MVDSMQEKIASAMREPGFYPHGAENVQEVQTHISRVFLAGDFVYKIKKSVNLGFLDFTSLEKRRECCENELRLNARLAPDVYLEVVPITVGPKGFVLGGAGEAVEYAVKMKRLDDGFSMESLLAKNAVSTRMVTELAQKLAAFHTAAATGPEVDVFGSWDVISRNCEENFVQTGACIKELVDERAFQIICAATRTFLSRRRDLFESRVKTGRIRDCHGDLKTEHVYFLPQGVAVIDCIEFNERFRYGDVTSDMAFLAMECDHEGFTWVSQKLMEDYARFSGDHDVFALMDFYKCYRALVRAKVKCLRLAGGGVSRNERRAVIQEIAAYSRLAYRYAVQFSRPALFVVCGMIASGKSTVAQALGKSLGIRVFQSDAVRKELFHKNRQGSTVADFEKGMYAPAATSLVYGRLLLLAQEELSRGLPVVLDATYASRHERGEAMRLARDMDADIVFVECVCSEEKIRERLAKRETTPGLSDARLEHLAPIRQRFEPLDEIAPMMHVRVSTDTTIDQAMDQVLAQDYALLSLQALDVLKSRG